MTWFGASAWIVTEPRPRGKRPKRGSLPRITIPQLRTLHDRHLAGESINALAEEVWTRAGYASASAAAVSIGAQFRRMGWRTRPQPEASSLRQRTAPTGGRARTRTFAGNVKTPKRSVLP